MSSAGALKRGSTDPEEEEEEELSVLMHRIKAAKPPAEVLKVKLYFCWLLKPLSAGKVAGLLSFAQ
jgi:hypothetical protein